MSSQSKKLIAVVGATGQQGGAVVRALQAQGQFNVRALTRHPGKQRALADEVVEADLDRPETLDAAFAGAYGVFLVTNFWEPGTDEIKQATAAVHAAKKAGVSHFIWSTLPDVEKISGGKLHVPHFTGKAKVDPIVKEAGFAHHTFVVAPFFYQNLVGLLAPQKQEDGTLGWVLPIDPTVRGIHMGDIREIGDIVAGAFAHPDQAGNGEYLPLVGDFMSFNEIVDTLNRQGHRVLIQTSPRGSIRQALPGCRRDRSDVCLVPGLHLFGRGLARPNRARQQASGPATDQVLDMGPSQSPGSRERLISPFGSTPLTNPKEILMNTSATAATRGVSCPHLARVIVECDQERFRARGTHFAFGTVPPVRRWQARRLCGNRGVHVIGRRPGVLLPVVIATETLGAIAIMLGWQTRVAAVLLAGYSLLAALLFHTDFANQIEMIMFLKNVSIAGGFLLLATHGAGPLSLDRRYAK